MTALDELRQALAEWDRLTKAATPGPWASSMTWVYEAEKDGVESLMAPQRSEADADLIVAAVGLADTVRAILADAISLVGEWEPQAAESYTPDALRLARKINENAA